MLLRGPTWVKGGRCLWAKALPSLADGGNTPLSITAPRRSWSLEESIPPQARMVSCRMPTTSARDASGGCYEVVRPRACGELDSRDLGARCINEVLP